MMNDLWPILVTGVSSIVGGGALVGFFKERRRDNALADLTSVEALQKQVIAVTEINSFLRKEIDQLRKDYDESEEGKRRMRIRLSEVEDELEALKRSSSRAIQTLQERCDALSRQVKSIREGNEDANTN